MNSMPVQVGIGWSRDNRSPLSLSIRYFTRPGLAPRPLARWSHMFLVFRFGNGSAVIHEALASQGWCAKPAQKLTAWYKRDPRNHKVELCYLPVDADTVERIYKASTLWIGTKSYAIRQLASLATAKSLLGRYLGLALQPGPNEIVCSEGAARIIGCQDPEWDLRDDPEDAWDNVTPESAYNRYLEKIRERSNDPATAG